jgi:NADH:ubiquinone reductase (H+-translocating)
MEKHVVILGAGFGGVRVALDLARASDFRITLVNESPYHCFHADLYEVVAAPLKHSDRLAFENLLGTVNIPLTEIFPHGVDLLIDQVQAVDLEKRQIILKNQELSYDFLVLALGSSSHYFNIPGAKDHSHALKTAEDALNIHNDLEELMEKGQLKEVVIAGGGFTGVELAGNLAGFLKDRANISVIEGSDHLLGGMPDWAQKEALKRLTSLGVKVMLESQIAKVVQNQISIKDKGEVDFNYLIWTAGVKAAELPGWIKGVQFSPKGQIITQSDLSVLGHEEVFVAGDQSSLEGIPQTAWAAREEGALVASNIASGAKEGFKLRRISFDVPIGRGYALSNKLNLKLTGRLGWITKRISALNYFRSILPLPKALDLWFQGVKIYPK